MTPLDQIVREHIKTKGPMRLDHFMGIALSDPAHGYYMARQPFGAGHAKGGDFITAPEVSQIFGELLALWAIDLWQRSGSPETVYHVELGPGRGTLAADMRRVFGKFDLSSKFPCHLVETSPALRELQSSAVPQSTHHATIKTLPREAPSLIFANEFFDALPIRQFIRKSARWYERHLEIAEDELVYCELLSDPPPGNYNHVSDGEIYEFCPLAQNIMHEIAQHLTRTGGACLAIDYGSATRGVGDTLQAMRAHQFTSPLSNVGENDLTAHVSFADLKDAAVSAGCVASNIVTQGAFLRELGITARVENLSQANPVAASNIHLACDRLIGPDQMGHLFKVLCISSASFAVPAGFSQEPI